MLGGYEDGFGHLDKLYPFKDVLAGSRIVIFGAGDFGIELVKFINRNNKYKLVLWVDNNLENQQDVAISCPDNINNFEYEYIIIAVTNPIVMKTIKNELINKGIEESKIKTIEKEMIRYEYIKRFFSYNEWGSL